MVVGAEGGGALFDWSTGVGAWPRASRLNGRRLRDGGGGRRSQWRVEEIESLGLSRNVFFFQIVFFCSFLFVRRRWWG